jgi:hypothetical protein
MLPDNSQAPLSSGAPYPLRFDRIPPKPPPKGPSRDDQRIPPKPPPKGPSRDDQRIPPKPPPKGPPLG